jgi:hypothetical protein
MKQQINEQSKKFLDKNDTGIVPKHVWYGMDPAELDRPAFVAVKNGEVRFSGTKSQCKNFI